MNTGIIVLIIFISLTASILEYKKLVLAIKKGSSLEEFYKFICEKALIKYISNMNPDEFESFCMEFFRSAGYMVKVLDNNTIALNGLKDPIYVKYLKVDPQSGVETRYAMELYGLMCHDGIKQGIIFSNSQLDDDAAKFCSDINISTMDVYSILDELKCNTIEENQELLPGLNS